jgi:hypothetical protein
MKVELKQDEWGRKKQAGQESVVYAEQNARVGKDDERGLARKGRITAARKTEGESSPSKIY